MTILQIAILGAGIFVKTQYYPRLSEISDIVSVKFIWSPSEEFPKSAVEIARKHFGGLEAVWGNQGLDRGINGGSCLGVAVVRARQFQMLWPVVGLKGTIQIEHGNQNGCHGYKVLQTLLFLGAMMESGSKYGARIHVKKF